ncbi:MAG: hypothetical protein ACTSRT_21785 [Promethearchaeota archaeon]
MVKNENHAMSWTYSLDLDFGISPPAIPGYIVILMVMTMIGIIVILQKKKLKIIK